MERTARQRSNGSTARGGPPFTKTLGVAMRVALIVGSIAMAAAFSVFARDTVDDRVKYWAARLPMDVPIGAPEAKLAAWLNSMQIKFGRDPGTRAVSFVAEELKGDGLVCKSWYVLVTAALSESGSVAAYRVSRAGVCL